MRCASAALPIGNVFAGPSVGDFIEAIRAADDGDGPGRRLPAAKAALGAAITEFRGRENQDRAGAHLRREIAQTGRSGHDCGATYAGKRRLNRRQGLSHCIMQTRLP
jgi:hypothetical protein